MRKAAEIVLAVLGFIVFVASVTYLFMCVDPPKTWVPHHHEQGHYEWTIPKD